MAQGTPLPHVRRRRDLRAARLRRLGYVDYRRYLRSAHWARKRNEFYASRPDLACICGEAEGLQLHHRTYDRVGAELLDDLIALCPGCHAAVHVLEARGDIKLDLTGLTSEERAAANRLLTAAIREQRTQEDADYEAAKWAHLQVDPAQRYAHILEHIGDGHPSSDFRSDIKLINYLVGAGHPWTHRRVLRALDRMEAHLRRAGRAARI